MTPAIELAAERPLEPAGWSRWLRAAVRAAECDSLDGDQATVGYSLTGARAAFDAGIKPAAYAERVRVNRAVLAARAKAEAAARAQYVRDGSGDMGDCGGAMLGFDSRTGIARAAIEYGFAHRQGNETFLNTALPADIRTQHSMVYVAYAAAFRDEIKAQGYGRAIKRYWTYRD